MGKLVVEGLDLVIQARHAAIAKLRREAERTSSKIDKVGRQLDALVDQRRATLNAIANLENDIAVAQQKIFEEGGKQPTEEEMRLFRSGQVLEAVKRYRDRHSVSLMQARKILVDWKDSNAQA